MASFFPRMAAKIKQQSLKGSDAPTEPEPEPNIIAMQDEHNFSAAREAVMDALNVQHPISHDQYDICLMVKENKLGVLKFLCENLNIPKPPDQRRKAPYISSLQELVKSCSYSKV